MSGSHSEVMPPRLHSQVAAYPDRALYRPLAFDLVHLANSLSNPHCGNCVNYEVAPVSAVCAVSAVVGLNSLGFTSHRRAGFPPWGPLGLIFSRIHPELHRL